MRSQRRRGAWLALGAAITMTSPAPAQRNEPGRAVARPAVDSLVARVLAEWQVPGVAIGVVRDGRVVLAMGAGFRDRERRLPVTPTTMFGIGSNSDHTKGRRDEGGPSRG